jgi:hypothetical protein
MWRRLLVSTLVAVSTLHGTSFAQAPTLMIPNVTTRYVVARAIDGAKRLLEAPRCQGLLDEFSDATGATLRTALNRDNVTPAEFLVRLRYVDGNESPQCQRADSLAAFTIPGNRVIFICGLTFDVQLREKMRAAQMIIIHEMLHAAGLGENPPTSRDITARVTKRCGA